MKKVIVSKFLSMPQLLREWGLVEADTPIVEIARPVDVRGRDVYGASIPLHLAALATSVTIVHVRVPAELRGEELDIHQLRKYACAPKTYIVTEISGEK